MTYFNVSKSGHDFGDYRAEDRDGAIIAHLKDAGISVTQEDLQGDDPDDYYDFSKYGVREITVADQIVRAMQTAINVYKMAGGENHGAFSVNVYRDAEDPDLFEAECDFHEHHDMMIMYDAAEGNADIVETIFIDRDADEHLLKIAGIIIENNWID